MIETKEQRMEITEKELFFAASEAHCEAWRAHKKAEDVFIKAGSILGSEAFHDYVRTYTLYNEAGIAASNARRVWDTAAQAKLPE